MNTPRFTIGTQYLTLEKNARLCTVTDILTTTNSKGEIVRITYVATHEFMGQLITNHAVTDTTIARGIARMEGKRY